MFGSTPRKPVDTAENKQLDPKRRTLFGIPLTKAQGRLQDLRESGYRGWIDQDGNRVSDVQLEADLARWRRRANGR